MQNNIPLGEFIKANILTKKFNESLWGLVNEVCGGLKGSLNMLIPKELCLSLLLFFSYASSLHNGAKPLCKFGLTNPRALLLQKTKAGGRAPSHHGVCLRWDCCMLWASSSIRRWLYTVTVPGDDRRLCMEVLDIARSGALFSPARWFWGPAQTTDISAVVLTLCTKG